MNHKQVQRFVLSFLEQTGCRILEKSPAHVVVKLSPEADRALTNRHFYWSFVDRTGAEPETMTFAWHFEPPAKGGAAAQGSAGGGMAVHGGPAVPGYAGGAGNAPAPASAGPGDPPPGSAFPGGAFPGGVTPSGTAPVMEASSELGTPAAGAAPAGEASPVPGAAPTSGAAPVPPHTPAPGFRVLTEQIHFGSGRLNQLFDYVRQNGRNVLLFAEPPRGASPFSATWPYTAWLGVNFKVSYECDVKRDELYGWGISLATGVIDERFRERVQAAKLTARLPEGVHVLKNTLSPRKAMAQLEAHLERKLKRGDFSWAVEAESRRLDELERVVHYYRPLIERAENAEQREALKTRLKNREAEIDWQYRPRVTVSVINCGIFHFPGID